MLEALSRLAERLHSLTLEHLAGFDQFARRLERLSNRLYDAAAPSGYQLRVVLRVISPLICRRLLVRSDITLAHLHDILQMVFHWSDEHLHSFQVHGREYGSSGAQTSC